MEWTSKQSSLLNSVLFHGICSYSVEPSDMGSENSSAAESPRFWFRAFQFLHNSCLQDMAPYYIFCVVYIISKLFWAKAEGVTSAWSTQLEHPDT